MDDKVAFESGGALIPWPIRPGRDATPEQKEEYVVGVKRYYVDRVHILREIAMTRLAILRLTPIGYALNPMSSEIAQFSSVLYKIGSGPIFVNMVDGTLRFPAGYIAGGTYLEGTGVIRESDLNIGTALNATPSDSRIYDLVTSESEFNPANVLNRLTIELSNLTTNSDDKPHLSRQDYRRKIINDIQEQIIYSCNTILPEHILVQVLIGEGYLMSHQE